MKNADMKVIAIILSIALLFTVVTSNAVSIASVVFLAKGETTQSGTVGADGGSSSTGDNSVSSGNVASTPSGDSGSASAGDSSSTPAGDSSSTATNNGGSTATNSGSSTATNNGGSASTNNGGSASADANAWDKAKVFNFYKAACEKITNSAAAGHTRKEWQEVQSLDLGSASSVLQPILQSFMKTEDQAEAKVSAKGSDDAKRRMAPCGADISYVKSATKQDLANGNYKITIIMNDENTPKKGSKGVAAMATGILYMEDVEDTVKNDSTVSKVVKSLDKGEIVYKAYTIVAEMTKDGKFVSIDHSTVGEISADVKLIVGSVSGSGSLAFTSKWYDFKY